MTNIKNITVEKYKCFTNKVTLENIKPINVIVGKNNIGKSSILNVIEMTQDTNKKLKSMEAKVYITYEHYESEELEIHREVIKTEMKELDLLLQSPKALSGEYEFQIEIEKHDAISKICKEKLYEFRQNGTKIDM